MNAAPLPSPYVGDLGPFFYFISYLFFMYLWLPIVPSLVAGVLAGHAMNEYDEFLGLVWGFGVGLVFAIAGLSVLLSVPVLDSFLIRAGVAGGSMIEPPSAGEMLCQTAMAALAVTITLMGCRWWRKRELRQHGVIP